MTSLRVRLFAHLQRLSVGWFERRQVGDLISRLTGDIATIEQLVLTGVNLALTYAFQVIFFAGAMFLLNWHLTLTSLIAAPAFLLLSRAFSRRIQAASRERRRRSGSITAVAEENLGNIPLVQAYDRADHEVERFAKENRAAFSAQMLAIRLEALFGPFSSLVECIGVLAVTGVAVYELAQGAITLGGLLAFLAYLGQLYGPVQGFAGLSNTLFAASAGAERIIEVLDEQPAVAEPQEPHVLGRAAGAIRFEKVWFTYDGTEQPALRGVDLRLAPGRKIAIVGASGAGKSTLTKLLLRSYDPDRGRVTLDGHRPARAVAHRSAPQHQHGAAGDPRLRRHRRREHPVGQARRHRRGGARGGRSRRRARLHRAARPRLRHPGRPARQAAVRRSTPTAGDRPRHHPGCAAAAPRRADHRAGRRVGAAGARSAAQADGGPHHDHHLARPAHGDRCRRDRRPRRGRRQRRRPPRGTAGHLADLRAPLRPPPGPRPGSRPRHRRSPPARRARPPARARGHGACSRRWWTSPPRRSGWCPAQHRRRPGARGRARPLRHRGPLPLPQRRRCGRPRAVDTLDRRLPTPPRRSGLPGTPSRRRARP